MRKERNDMKKVSQKTIKQKKVSPKKLATAAKAKSQFVVFSPVEISIVKEDGKTTNRVVRGALLPKKTIDAIITLIDKSNSNGLTGKDAVLLIQLKNAASCLKR